MQRDAKLFDFPPDKSELEVPVEHLTNAGTAVTKAMKALAQLLVDVQRFPAVGEERPKQVALRYLQQLLHQYGEMRGDITKMQDHTSDAGDLLTKAFHDPMKGRYDHPIEVMARTTTGQVR